MATQRIKNKDGEWVLVNNGGGGSTSDIIVDSELSSESTNPIQNKAVTESLKNRPELLEIRYYFGEKELTEEDKAINAASFNTYVTNIINNTKNLYKFFIPSEYFGRAESSVEAIFPDSEGNPTIEIVFGDLYGIYSITDGDKVLPYVIVIDSTGNIIMEMVADGPYNAAFSIGEDSGDFLEWVERAHVVNPYVSSLRPIHVLKEYKINGNTKYLYGLTITPIEEPPGDEPFSFSCIFDDGYVHTIKLDKATGYLIEDTIVDTSSNSNEIAVLGNSAEADIAILDKYSALGCPPLTVYGGNGEGGGTTIGGYGKNSGGEYYYYFLDSTGLLYRYSIIKNDNSDGTSEYTVSSIVINRDCIYLHPDMQESDDFAQLNRVTLADTAMTAFNRLMPAPITCYKGEALGVGSPQMVTITPLRAKILLKEENDVINYYTECTILGDSFNTIEVWEVSHTTGVATLVSTTPFTDILGLNTNA